MSLYELFYGFWDFCFYGAYTEQIEAWVPLFSMLSVVAVVFGIFIAVSRIFK